MIKLQFESEETVELPCHVDIPNGDLIYEYQDNENEIKFAIESGEILTIPHSKASYFADYILRLKNF